VRKPKNLKPELADAAAHAIDRIVLSRIAGVEDKAAYRPDLNFD
jgi:hypothetical protein